MHIYTGAKETQMPSNANALPTLIFDTLAFSHRVILPGCLSLSLNHKYSVSMLCVIGSRRSSRRPHWPVAELLLELT